MPRRARPFSPLLLALLLAACGGGGGAAPTSPGPDSGVTPPGPDPLEGVEELPPAECCLGEDLEPGEYRSPMSFGLDFALEVPAGWRVVNSEGERLLALTQGENEIGHATVWLSFFRVPGGPGPDDVIAGMTEIPRTQAGEPVASAVGGVEGVQVDVTARPNPQQPATGKIVKGAINVVPVDELVPGFYYTESAEARMRFIAVKTGGSTLLVYIETTKDGGDTELGAATALMGTFRFPQGSDVLERIVQN